MAARWLAPETIGVFALASALVLAGEYGVFDAISETIIQRPSLEPAHLGAAVTMAADAAGICGLLWFVLACCASC